ncbi:glycosyltransferase family 2 protein [Erythrobacteraceae bacterium CFH 75059]|uniref:glycosyltransferase n=1 Tax=Qipengyuania thermophila TaxID=2509361 RepID=UPI00102193F7|nr:glycosyltransferase family 2 protein [Qipengyuania thermophila]TCD06560.1 glycosyltransferase family 2 protein [Erythrobacteraceae bacterium CFH 75059]
MNRAHTPSAHKSRRGGPEGASENAEAGDLVETVLGSHPFAGAPVLRASACEGLQHWRETGGFQVVAIPAHQEEDYIPAALDALAHAAKDASRPPLVVVVVNNSEDGTWPQSRKHLQRSGLPHLVLDIVLADGQAHVGFARRLAMDLAARIAPAGMILSTDADSQVDPGWLIAANTALNDAALACGTIRVDPRELAALPPTVLASGEAEAELEGALDRLWRRITGITARGFANKGSGANLVIRARDYHAVGGLPVTPVGEDRALHAAVERAGLAIRHAAELIVTTSCRTACRAPGGMADCLATRSVEADPPLDAELMPAATLLRRALVTRALLHGDARLQARLTPLLGLSEASWRALAAGPSPLAAARSSGATCLAARRLHMTEGWREARLARSWWDALGMGIDPVALLGQAGDGATPAAAACG